VCSALSTDHCGHSQFTGNYRGMARAPAMIGDDRSRNLHDRFPIGAGCGCHQHLSRPELLEISNVADHPYRPGGNLLANRSAAHQHWRALFEREDFEARGPLRRNRFGARLHDIEASVFTILCPFDIHRHGMARDG